MINKQAITTKFIIWTILSIAGFVLVLFLYFQLSITGSIDKQACHQSIVLRGTLPNLANLNEYVPLKCKTEKICIASGLFGGECEEFTGTKGITKVKVKSKEQLEKILVENIFDCWSMSGEGKLSLFSQWLAKDYGLGEVYPTCLICSRIAFDTESLNKAGIKLEEINLRNYMLTNKIPGKDITYYNYLNAQGNAGLSTDQITLTDFEITKNYETGELGEKIALREDIQLEKPTEAQLKEINNNEMAVIFMQVSAPEHLEVFMNTLVGAGITYGSSRMLPARIAKPLGTAIKKVWWIAAIGAVYQQGSVAWNRAVTATYCDDISTGSESRSGCSAVRTIDYNEDSINQHCSYIETIP